MSLYSVHDFYVGLLWFRRVYSCYVSVIFSVALVLLYGNAADLVFAVMAGILS